MRSLKHVLAEMHSDFEEVCFAQIYTVSERDLSVVKERVLGYMRRESSVKSRVMPVLACVEVPRLPKDGHIEISLICWQGDAESKATVRSCEPSGSVAVSRRTVNNSCVVTVDFVAVDEGPSLSKAVLIVDICVDAAWQELVASMGKPPSGVSLQVQHVALNGIASATHASAQRLGFADKAAVTHMPVLFLGEKVPLRVVAIACA